MKNSFLAGTLLAFAPVAVLAFSGCSGGSGGLSTTASSVVAATPTPVPTSQTVTLTSNLTLANGQGVVFTSQVRGTAISGTLKVSATSTVTSSSIPAGTYSYVGTITAAGAFTSNGTFSSFGAFNLSGQLPTATKVGTYNLTVNRKTETGIIPIPALPASSYNLIPNLTFSNVVAGANVVATPISSFNNLTGGGKLTTATYGGAKYQSVALTGRTSVSEVTRDLAITLVSKSGVNVKPFSVGQVVALSPQGSQMLFSQTIVKGTAVTAARWFNTSGSATIKAIGTNSITVDFNAHFEPIMFGGGKGSFNLKGTVTGTGLTVISVSG